METDSHKQLGAALGRIPSGLFVLTARQGTRDTGMLVSWAQQCAFEPPHVSVAIRRDRDILGWLTDGSSFVLNILDGTQTDMIVHFGRGFALGEPAFTGLDVERRGKRAPVLREALAYLDCRVTGQLPAGEHVLLVSQVTAGMVLGEGTPMVHVRKSGFHY